MPPPVRVIRRMISSLRCTGPVTRLVAAWSEELAGFFRHRSWDFDPSQFFSDFTGVVAFGDHGPTCRLCRRFSRALAFVFFVPRTASPAGEPLSIWRHRLLGFGPVGQPYHADRRPRYSFLKGRSVTQVSPAMGFGSSLRFTDAARRPRALVLCVQRAQTDGLRG